MEILKIIAQCNKTIVENMSTVGSGLYMGSGSCLTVQGDMNMGQIPERVTDVSMTTSTTASCTGDVNWDLKKSIGKIKLTKKKVK